MTPGAIDGYLEQLADELVRMGLRQRRIARILAEVRDHLEESARRLRAQGRTADVAQREAVARFGSPAALARSYLDALAEGAALANGAVFSPDTLAATSRPVGRAVTATRRGKGGKGMQVRRVPPGATAGPQTAGKPTSRLGAAWLGIDRASAGDSAAGPGPGRNLLSRGAGSRHDGDVLRHGPGPARRSRLVVALGPERPALDQRAVCTEVPG